MKRLIALLFFAFLGYTGWALALTWRGHNIETYDTDRYRIKVDRVPFRFSLLTPAYGTRMFPGYIRISVFTPYGMQITSYSVNWDSFYPDSARISEKDDRIEVDFTGGAVIACTIQQSISQEKVLWHTGRK
jgi:hypothetical protein